MIDGDKAFDEIGRFEIHHEFNTATGKTREFLKRTPNGSYMLSSIVKVYLKDRIILTKEEYERIMNWEEI